MRRIPAFLLVLLAVALSLPPVHAAEKPKKRPAIEIDVVPGVLRFATTRFDVTAGESFAVTLTNTCIMPHNWVLTQPGEAENVMVAAMAMTTEGPAKGYIPETKSVLAHTGLVNPGQSETAKFTVPKTPGEYPYLCTFPGHGTIMRGIMRVKAEGEPLEPPVVEKFDQHKAIDVLKLSGVNSQPMGTKEHPFVLRSFVPNPGLGHRVLAHYGHGYPAPGYDVAAGKDIEGKTIDTIPGIPAGIAVSFGPDFAYVWDATECRLLYAWMGGFLDMTPYWGSGTGSGRRSRDYVPALVGTMVYKASGTMPLEIGDALQKAREELAEQDRKLSQPDKPGEPKIRVQSFVESEKPKFCGYKMLSGNPEFMYEISGVRIHELIAPGDPGTFMIHYRVDKAAEPVRFNFDGRTRPLISCDSGTWKENTLEIPVDHADQFMLLVKFQTGETFKFDPKPMKGSTSAEP